MKESPKPYILYIGNNYPHKNLERLRLAFDKLIQESELEHELVLITEFVSEPELEDLYKNASLFIFPSLYEGFGLPPLEAMKRGLPVVSSNTTCMPEILEEAALYFDPLDIEDMAEKIKQVLIDENLRSELVKKGYEQIKNILGLKWLNKLWIYITKFYSK